MIYLLDTNVLSERTKRRPSAKVLSFLRKLPVADARVPAIVLGEIKQGVQSNPTPELSQFLEDVLTLPVATLFRRQTTNKPHESTKNCLHQHRNALRQQHARPSVVRANRQRVCNQRALSMSKGSTGKARLDEFYTHNLALQRQLDELTRKYESRRISFLARPLFSILGPWVNDVRRESARSNSCFSTI